MCAIETFDGKLFIPPQAHLSENSSQQSLTSSTQASSLSDWKPTKSRTLPDTRKEQASVAGLRSRFVEEFRKNYCPWRSPTLVLPSAPTDGEKYSYINMKRVFLVSCATVALLSLAVGAWMFAKAAPLHSWYAVYVFVTESISSHLSSSP